MSVPNHLTEAAAAIVARNNNGHPSSLDFHRKRELDWDRIEIELNILSVRVAAVELLGRTAIDSIHSQRMDEIFSQVADDIDANVTRLKALLGLDSGGEEVRS